MTMSAQFECVQELMRINCEALTTTERIAVAQVLATLAQAEAMDAIATAIWSTRTRHIGDESVEMEGAVNG